VKTSDEPIIVEETYPSSVESVWNSLTDIDLMRQWYFENIPAFKPEIGFETQFKVQSEDKDFLHKWKVTEVQPLKMIQYTWAFENYLGKSFATFEVVPQDAMTNLKLTVDILEDFPDDIPEFTTESCVAGWKFFINGRLKDFLGKKN